MSGEKKQPLNRSKTPGGSAKRDRIWTSILDAVIAATFATATALEGLLLAGTPMIFGLNVLGFAVGSVVLLGGLAGLRAWIMARRAGRGTLYYVRMLDAGMTDTHREDLDAIRKNHEDVRAVTAWIPPHTDSILAKAPRLAGIDVTGEAAVLAQRLQIAMNDDTNDTSFAIVPNLLWPLAVSVGYQSYLFDNTWLVEADKKERWALHPTPKSRDSWLVRQLQRQWRWRRTHTPKPPESWLVKQPATAVAEGGDQPSLVVLTLDLTGPVTIPECWDLLPEQNLRGADQTAVTLTQSEVGRVTSDGWTNRLLDGWVATRDCSAAIVEVLQANPEVYVLLAARLPKSVAFGLGWRLGQKLDVPTKPSQSPSQRPKPAYFNPWARLITVQLDPPMKLVTRVHPSQPPLAEMIEIASCVALLQEPECPM